MEKNENISEPLDELDEDIVEEAEENTDDLDEADAASEYNDSAAQFADLEDALAEEKDKYLRLFAEYDNYRKRTAKEKTETYQNASVQCVEKLLPVLDSFERSLEAECSDENFKNGMNMIYNQFKSFLTQMNVSEIEALGAEFDPNLHNAVMHIESDEFGESTVAQVFSKGYKCGDRIIRCATVQVAN